MFFVKIMAVAGVIFVAVAYFYRERTYVRPGATASVPM
jgi:hypothetical protein